MRDEVVLTDQAQRGLVCVVEALPAYLAVPTCDLFDGALVVLGAVLGLAAREPGQSLLRGFELSGRPCGRGAGW